MSTLGALDRTLANLLRNSLNLDFALKTHVSKFYSLVSPYRSSRHILNPWDQGDKFPSPDFKSQIGIWELLKSDGSFQAGDHLNQELKFYLDAFRSNFANKEALFALESESLQNRKLLQHFIWLLETETLDKISIQEHGGFLDGSGWGVVAQYRRFFVEEFSPTLTHRQCLDLVERYITCSLWSAYRHWRENPDSPDSICLFNNWQGAKPVLIQATIQFLETQAAEKWAKMKDIRDRFLVRWKFAQKKLQDATLPATIKEVFNCSQKTWKCALKAVAKDIRYDRIPSTSGSAAALVLAWSVDSRRNSDVYSTAVSTEFYAALNQWVALGNGGTDGFVSLCWPEWTKYSTANHPRTLQDSTAFSELFPSIACSPVSVDGSQVTRWILADCMDEEDMDLFESEICVEAAAVAATLGNSDYPSDSSSVTNPRHDPISSHPGRSERGELQHEIDPGFDPESVLVHGIIIVGIIVTFLLEIRMLNFSPLLLLFLLPLDGSSYLADVLQSFSAAWIMLGNEVLVGIFQSPLFERIISKVRRGILQDISEVEFALLQLVQPDAIGTILNFCASCTSHMRKTGMLQCEGGWIWEHHIPLGTDGDGSQPGTVDGRVGSWSEIPFQFANTTPPYYDPLFGESSISQRAGYVSTTGSSEHPLSNAPRSYEVANIITDPEDLAITAAETFHSSPQLIPSAVRNTTTASSSPIITPSSSGRSEPSVQTHARRLYRCHICSATFPAKSNCTRHEKTVHGRTIPCDHCGKPVKVGRADYRELHRRTCKAQSG